MPKQEKGANASTLLGAAAEYYVLCQLLRRRQLAGLTPTGVPYADIIVTDEYAVPKASIQVKARRDIGSDGGWHMKAKHEKGAHDELLYAFVDFGPSSASVPACWIIPSRMVADVLAASYQAWLRLPGKNGNTHKEHGMRRLLPDYTKYGLAGYGLGWMNQYKECWSLIVDRDVAAD